MKNLMKTNGFALLLGILTLMTTKAQEAEWQLLHEADGITFSYKIVNCSGPDFIVCQIENSNAQAASVIFQLLGNDGLPLILAERQALILEAGQTLTGSCEIPHPGLFIPKTSPTEETLTLQLETNLISQNL